MINHNHKFIFIHIPKTGGTSLEYFFCKNEEVPHKHFNATSCKRHFSQQWDNYFKFSIVRNPWDKVVSQWCMQKKRYGNSIKSFKQFVEVPQGFPLQPQLWYLSEPSCISYNSIINYVQGNIDFILRFENLQEDFNNLCSHLNINPQKLPHRFSSSSIRNSVPYQDFYDDESKEMVRRIYNIDIEYFKYEF